MRKRTPTAFRGDRRAGRRQRPATPARSQPTRSHRGGRRRGAPPRGRDADRGRARAGEESWSRDGRTRRGGCANGCSPTSPIDAGCCRRKSPSSGWARPSARRVQSGEAHVPRRHRHARGSRGALRAVATATARRRRDRSRAASRRRRDRIRRARRIVEPDVEPVLDDAGASGASGVSTEATVSDRATPGPAWRPQRPRKRRRRPARLTRLTRLTRLVRLRRRPMPTPSRRSVTSSPRIRAEASETEPEAGTESAAEPPPEPAASESVDAAAPDSGEPAAGRRCARPG